MAIWFTSDYTLEDKFTYDMEELQLQSGFKERQ